MSFISGHYGCRAEGRIRRERLKPEWLSDSGSQERKVGEEEHFRVSGQRWAAEPTWMLLLPEPAEMLRRASVATSYHVICSQREQ